MFNANILFDNSLVSFPSLLTKLAIIKKEITFTMNDPFDPDFGQITKMALIFLTLQIYHKSTAVVTSSMGSKSCVSSCPCFYLHARLCIKL